MDKSQKMLLIELERFKAEMRYQYEKAVANFQQLYEADDKVGGSFFEGKAAAYKRAYDLISNAMLGLTDEGEQR